MMSSLTVSEDEQMTLNDHPDDETPDDALIPSSSSSEPLSASNDLDDHDDTLRSVLPTLIISILLGLVSGTAYGFGRYARTLKDILGLSQSQVQTLGIFMDCGNYVGHPLVGIIYDRKGPVVSCLLGALIAFVSYWEIRWTILNHDEQDLSHAGILWLKLAFFGVGFSSGLAYISGLGTTTKALLKLTGPSSRYFGTVIGLVAASAGLSSTLVGISYQHSPNLQGFFLFWALIVPVVNIFGAIMFQIQEYNNAPIERLTESDGPIREVGPLLCSPALESAEAQESQQVKIDEEVLLNEDNNVLMEAWDSWQKLEFWLLFASFSCASGCGLLVINNLSTMVQSMGGSDSLAGTLVIVLSLSNVGGRLLMGMLGDAATPSNSPVLPRIRLLQGVNLTMALAMFLAFIFGQQQVCLILFVVIVALAYGSAWVLIVALTPKLFAKEHFGKSYGLLALGPAMSGLIFNQASAKWYDQHASNNTCIGRECYGTSYAGSMAVALIGVIITGILHKLQRRKEGQ
ncbi:unnamed protein product [Cylindrotheca closterium]|uniref:Nodulin-like domain-containing protein n=1 Tax=Cylindrotheca closterium TaxID=2856 RepID=A0AAD2FX03_9STRA|nr:unnamed protein product [Cylindrotheca closterium]